MNVSIVAVAAMLGSALLFTGCNSPESVCKKLVDLRAADAKEKPSDDDKKKALGECTKELEEENRRLKKMYAEERLKAEIVKEALAKKW